MGKVAAISPLVRFSRDELAPLRLEYIWGVGGQWDEPQRVRSASKDTSSAHHLYQELSAGDTLRGEVDEPHRYHRLKKTLRNLRLALEATPHSNRQAEHICLKTFEATCAGIVALKLTAQSIVSMPPNVQTRERRTGPRTTYDNGETHPNNLLESEAKLPHRGRGHK